MRILLFFDLPTLESEDLKEYRHFRKFLISNGFIMLQKSCYVKMLLNSTSLDNFLSKLNKNLLQKGLVQVITITEKQFQKMKILVGQHNNTILDSDERIEVFWNYN